MYDQPVFESASEDPRHKVATVLKSDLQAAGVTLPVHVVIAHGWSPGPGASAGLRAPPSLPILCQYVGLDAVLSVLSLTITP